MGCGMSTSSDAVAVQHAQELAATKARNAEMEAQLEAARPVQRENIKILLLGAGESGKSTIMKQIRLIDEGGFTAQERGFYKGIIFSNAVQSMRVILEAMKQRGIRFEYNDNQEKECARVIMSQPVNYRSEDLPPEVGLAVAKLWKNPRVKECFTRAREFQLNDSAEYYFNSIARIAAPSYLPNDQDVLRARVKTTGITECTFRSGGITYKIMDVGGQRSERKKWMHCFENVTCILFVVAISEYDQLLFEDESVNRMQEAMALFDSICNSRWFVDTPIALIMNKNDIFREKLKVSPLEDYFPDYDGGPNYGPASDYLTNRFLSLDQKGVKQIYTQFTCATESSQWRPIMTAVSDVIMQNNFKEATVIT